MLKIKLSNSNEYCLIDDDLTHLLCVDWRITPDGYVRGSYNKTRWFIHRLIMNAPSDMVVDHIDGNPLNNIRNNLRICTRRQNSLNSKCKKNKKYSNYKGVTYCATENRKKKWMAAMEINNKRITIGRFETEKEAAEAYNKKALEMFGEYAKLNKLEGSN